MSTLNYMLWTPDAVDATYFTDVEKRAFQYWEIVMDDLDDMFHKVASDQVYGIMDCKYSNILKLYKQLCVFLSIIMEERIMDANASDDGLDQGNEYYIDKYGIVEIRKALICRGFNRRKVNQVFTLYDLIYTGDDTGSTDAGIGFMTIEGTTEPIFQIY